MFLGRPHHQSPGLVVAQQAVDPVDLEGQIGGHPHRGQRRFLTLAGLLQALPEGDGHHRGGDGQHEERHQQDGPVDGGQRDADDDAPGSADEGEVADPLVVGLCLLELPVPLLDAGVHQRVLGVGAGRLGRLGQVAFPVEDLVGHVPQAVLVDPGQRGQVTIELGTGGQVAGSQAEMAAGLGRIDAGSAQDVEAVGRGEGLGDVGRAVDVDHAVASALGPEDGVSGPGIGGDLQVHARPPSTQPADQLGDQAFTFERTHAGDDGHSAVEVQGVRSLAGLDHESFEVHPRRIGVPGPDLEAKGLRLWALRPCRRMGHERAQAAGPSRGADDARMPKAPVGRLAVGWLVGAGRQAEPRDR